MFCVFFEVTRCGVSGKFWTQYADVGRGRGHPLLLLGRIFSIARTLADAARGFSAISSSVGCSVPRVKMLTTGAYSSTSTGKPGGVRLVASCRNTFLVIRSSRE